MRIPARPLCFTLLALTLGACDPNPPAPDDDAPTGNGGATKPPGTATQGTLPGAGAGIGAGAGAATSQGSAPPAGTSPAATTLPPFQSGLARDARLDRLTAADSTRLCTAVHGAVVKTPVVLEGLCKAAGVSAALQGTTGAERATCSAAREECRQLANLPPGDCDYSQCAGTVGELERCLDATRAYLACAEQSYPTCETIDATRAPGTGACNIADALLAVGLACKGGCSPAASIGAGMGMGMGAGTGTGTETGTETGAVQAGMTGSWVVRSVYFVDDTGALDFEVGDQLTDALVGQSMQLGSDGRFAFGPNAGTWTQAPLTRADRDRWMGTGAADDKLVLTWDGGQVDSGPIYESGAPSQPSVLHVYFRMQTPRPGQAVVTFGRAVTAPPSNTKK